MSDAQRTAVTAAPRAAFRTDGEDLPEIRDWQWSNRPGPQLRGVNEPLNEPLNEPAPG